MTKSDKGAHGGGNKIGKMPQVGFGDGFKKQGDPLKDKSKPGEKREPKSNKKKPGGAGTLGKKNK